MSITDAYFKPPLMNDMCRHLGEYPLSADTRWPFSGYGYGQVQYWSWQAIASWSLTSVPCKLLKSVTWTRVPTSSLILHLNFAHKIFENHLLNKFIYCTIGPSLIACTRSPNFGKEAPRCLAVTHHILLWSIFTKNIDLTVKIETSLAGCIAAWSGFEALLFRGSATS